MNLGTPWMLLLLPLIVLTGWLMARGRRLQWQAACRLKGVAPGVSSPRLRRNDYLVLAALVCIVLALARPQWNPRPHSVERRARDLVIVLDISRSMLAADVFPNRLETARIVIHEALPALAGQRIGLVTFAGSAMVRVPLTLDHEFVSYMLQRADPSDAELGSTSLQAAFETTVGTALTDATGSRQDVIILTDGEDHLSDIEQTTQLLAEKGVRVLIVGLGDPVQGARVPAISGTDPWMRYEDADVVSRLEEGTLVALSDRSPRVTYYPARTRPFDLVSLYQQIMAGTTDDVVVGELQEVRYTQGYPLLLALAVVFWFASSRRSVWLTRPLLLAVLLVPGCHRHDQDNTETMFLAKSQRGAELLQQAQEQSEVDLQTGSSLLRESRQEFLNAALLKPGDIDTARQITLATRRLHELERTLAEQREADSKRHEQLTELIKRLQQLADHQMLLAEQSRNVLRRRPPPSPDELNGLAAPIATEQQAVHEQTVGVLKAIRFHRDQLRQLLKRAYGVEELPPTELDPPANLLAAAAGAQQRAQAGLAPETLDWPQANTAMHVAAGRMQQALESLRSQLPPTSDQADEDKPSRNDRDDSRDMADADSEMQDTASQSISPGDFSAALSLRSLPVPSYTSEEILAEEIANQQERARTRAARANAQVEKNW